MRIFSWKFFHIGKSLRYLSSFFLEFAPAVSCMMLPARRRRRYLPGLIARPIKNCRAQVEARQSYIAPCCVREPTGFKGQHYGINKSVSRSKNTISPYARYPARMAPPFLAFVGRLITKIGVSSIYRRYRFAGSLFRGTIYTEWLMLMAFDARGRRYRYSAFLFPAEANLNFMLSIRGIRLFKGK